MSSMDDRYVLFVDDETNMILTLANNIFGSLSKTGVKVKVATNPQDACEIVRTTSNIIAAFVDLWMRDKASGQEDHSAGFEIIRQIADRHPHCKLIAFSAHIDGKIEEKLKGFNVA